ASSAPWSPSSRPPPPPEAAPVRPAPGRRSSEDAQLLIMFINAVLFGARKVLMSVALRYGDPAVSLSVLSDVVALQLEHRSVRAFTDRDVTDDELSALVAAAQSAPTSSNLQPWSVVAVRDADRKRRLAALAGQQAFIERAPLFLVWVA